MPQRKSGIKELKKNHTNKMHNLDIKTDLKKTIKKFLASVNEKNKDEAQSNLKLVYKNRYVPIIEEIWKLIEKMEAEIYSFLGFEHFVMQKGV